MTNISKAEAAMLGRRAEQPARNGDEILAVFVRGKLDNPLNGTPWVWQKRARYAKAWKERVAAAIFEEQYRGAGIVGVNTGWLLLMTEMDGLGPKRVSFMASTHNRMDGDGLQAALKPIRDALIVCRVIKGDAESDGNLFEYAQKIDRKRRGVEIRVAPRAPATEAKPRGPAPAARATSRAPRETSRGERPVGGA